MIHRKFIHEYSDKYGSWGWRPAWMPNFDPLQGMGIAHDILEHFPGDDGSVEGELMAHGAMLFVRGEGYFNQDRFNYQSDALETIAGDVPDLLYDELFWAGRTLGTPPRHIVEEEDEERLRTITHHAMSEARMSIGWRAGDHKDDLTAFLNKEMDERVLGWLRRGFVRAQHRYRRISKDSVLHVFKVIEQAADEYLRRMREMECRLATMMTVNVSLRRAQATVVATYPWGEEI
jgi:hypothetical protein